DFPLLAQHDLEVDAAGPTVEAEVAPLDHQPAVGRCAEELRADRGRRVRDHAVPEGIDGQVRRVGSRDQGIEGVATHRSEAEETVDADPGVRVRGPVEWK